MVERLTVIPRARRPACRRTGWRTASARRRSSRRRRRCAARLAGRADGTPTSRTAIPVVPPSRVRPGGNGCRTASTRWSGTVTAPRVTWGDRRTSRCALVADPQQFQHGVAEKEAPVGGALPGVRVRRPLRQARAARRSASGAPTAAQMNRRSSPIVASSCPGPKRMPSAWILRGIRPNGAEVGQDAPRAVVAADRAPHYYVPSPGFLPWTNDLPNENRLLGRCLGPLP